MKMRNTISIILSVSLAFCFGAPLSAFADEIIPQQQSAVVDSSVPSTVVSSYSQNESATLANTTSEEVSVDKIEDPEEGVAYTQGEVIVTYKDSNESEVKVADDANALAVVPVTDATVEAKAVVSQADEVTVATEKAPVTDVIASSDGETTVVAQTPDNMSVAQTIEALSADPNIESVEPNHILTLFDDDVVTMSHAFSNDPYSNADKQWYLGSVNCDTAWTYAKSDNNVAVAVLDTGCNLNHEDLRDNIVASYDATTKGTMYGDGDGDRGHGTHVSGIVSARSGNGVGISGVSYNADLVCIDVFDDDGSSSDKEVISAFQWLLDDGNATKYNVRVINMSFGNEDGYVVQAGSRIAKYIDKANAAGIVVVCAAGNTGTDQASYYADYSTCVGVMNLQNTGSGVALAANSTRGAEKDIAAPGSAIYSTAINGTYKAMSGTSMAAPVVSGVFAMMFAANPNLTADEAKNILYETATDVNIDYGHGEVNAQEAVRVASGTPEVTEPTSPDSSAESSNPPATSTTPTNPPATSTTPTTKSKARVAGSDAADTSAQIAAATFPNGSDWVVIARDDDFADAMSATGLAGTLHAPIILTDRNGLSSSAKSAIKNLNAKNCYIIGGNGAMPGNFESELLPLGITFSERVFGNDSWDTSVVCAGKIAANGGNPNGSAVVAMSSNFQDALSISSFAYKYGVPIYLETSGSIGRELPASAINSIRSLSGTIYVAGGTGAVPSSTVESVFGGRNIVRLSGDDGYDTSNQIATYMVSNNLLSADTVCVACGALAAKGSDALSGAALAGMNGGVMLLVNSNPAMEAERLVTISGTDSKNTPAFYSKNASSVKNAYVLGGAYVVSESLEKSL